MCTSLLAPQTVSSAMKYLPLAARSHHEQAAPPNRGMLAHMALIHWQTLAEWSRGLGGSQYLLIISVFEPRQDTRVYTHRKSPANLRAIFQKGEEMASEFPYLISRAGSNSPRPPWQGRAEERMWSGFYLLLPQNTSSSLRKPGSSRAGGSWITFWSQAHLPENVVTGEWKC